MRYIRELLSTLTSMSYYTGTDLLTDHSFPSYLQFVSENSHTPSGDKESLQNNSGENKNRLESVTKEPFNAKMNNSYPSR
ncbi:hypothetical protein [Vibrio superstes]|uniref:Uncharacterized protein n=1 Tax=Vibrio superstes NBRC 103154 TaxID=1219062 RepID=A0A511QRC9_9VIBR|nr:hypothetical protein [Vibrio superstes]GEM79899.1 hypothetical protein VSU01S_21440 [Vibrio superstes NBRC 103154]